MGIDRGIREVCTEALCFLRDECDPGILIRPERIAGYFDEILAIVDETEDDSK